VNKRMNKLKKVFLNNKKLGGYQLILLFSYSLILLSGCSKSDPVLEGIRLPVFRTEELFIAGELPADTGTPLAVQDCEFTIDGNNQVWKGKTKIFAGFPTSSEIKVKKSVACNGKFVYAGLSTGELVKINSDTREVLWTADIFAENMATGGSPFLDIIATPVVNDGFVYAGGLGGEFCKIADKDGKKIWCVPVSVQKTDGATDKFILVRTTDNKKYGITTAGKVYENASENKLPGTAE